MAKLNELIWITIDNETKRTYYFKDGSKFSVAHVIRIARSPSGNHRLETSDGRKFIIPPVFVAIEIEAPSWSA